MVVPPWSPLRSPTQFRVCPPPKVGGGVAFARRLPPEKSDGGHLPGRRVSSSRVCLPEVRSLVCLRPGPRRGRLLMTASPPAPSPGRFSCGGSGRGQGLGPRRASRPAQLGLRRKQFPSLVMAPGRLLPSGSQTRGHRGHTTLLRRQL